MKEKLKYSISKSWDTAEVGGKVCNVCTENNKILKSVL